MGTLNIIIGVVLVLAALVLIVTILMQQSRQQGLGAISGGAETFFGKTKARGIEAKLALITKISAAIFITLSLLMVILG